MERQIKMDMQLERAKKEKDLAEMEMKTTEKTLNVVQLQLKMSKESEDSLKREIKRDEWAWDAHSMAAKVPTPR